jgi:hypothetical protein
MFNAVKCGCKVFHVVMSMVLIDKNMVILQNCMDVLKVVPSSCCETCLITDDGNEAIDAKLSDVQEEQENPMTVSLPVLMDEHEVSFHC